MRETSIMGNKWLEVSMGSLRGQMSENGSSMSTVLRRRLFAISFERITESNESERDDVS